MTKKCDYCGREGTAPDVRGVKSAAVSVGNYRLSADVDVGVCEACADRIMGVAMGKLFEQLGTGKEER